MSKWEQIVCDMLNLRGVDQIPPPVRAHLERIDVLCAEVGGQLRSRQLIALVLTMYGVDVR